MRIIIDISTVAVGDKAGTALKVTCEGTPANNGEELLALCMRYGIDFGNRLCASQSKVSTSVHGDGPTPTISQDAVIEMTRQRLEALSKRP